MKRKMEDPDNPFDFPMSDDEFCEVCGSLLDYHEKLYICYECEMMMEEVIEECFSDSD